MKPFAWLRALVRRTHRHSKGDWAGDEWVFVKADGSPANIHVAKWRCSCGVLLVEDRDFNEYPHIVAGAGQ